MPAAPGRLTTALVRADPSEGPAPQPMEAAVEGWLQDGAHFYVCGDASRMAKDVDRALRDTAVAHGGLQEDTAVAYVEQLAADRRYVRDVY